MAIGDIGVLCVGIMFILLKTSNIIIRDELIKWLLVHPEGGLDGVLADIIADTIVPVRDHPEWRTTSVITNMIIGLLLEEGTLIRSGPKGHHITLPKRQYNHLVDDN